MSEKDLITLAISSLALVVATYGIFERRSATHRALRIRLTELIDALAKIKVDEAYARDSGKSEAVIKAVSDANASRRALLVAQVVDLLGKYQAGVTIPEYVNLAAAMRETSDTASEREIWELAVTRLKKQTPFNRAVAWRGLAYFCYDQGDIARARVALQRSLNANLAENDTARHERLQTLVAWFNYESRSASTDAAYLSSVLDQAESVLKEVEHSDEDWRLKLSDWARLARERLATGTAP